MKEITARFIPEHDEIDSDTGCQWAEPAELLLTVTDESINQLHSILQRALNCADPKLYPDWVELCDKLDSLKREGKI
jgi:hypothetical protein